MKTNISSAGLRLAWIGVFLLLVLAGCASAPKKPPPPSYDALMTRAEALVGPAGPEAAVAGFEAAARADPTRKEPWVRIAQLQFDRGDYPQAILAAREVQQRDAEDLVADGVTTVAGLRIAVESLQRLQRNGALATSATARHEAEALAATLRATMGDAILAPPDTAAKPAARKSRGRRLRPHPVETAPAAAPNPGEATHGGNPFDVLRGH